MYVDTNIFSSCLKTKHGCNRCNHAQGESITKNML